MVCLVALFAGGTTVAELIGHACRGSKVPVTVPVPVSGAPARTTVSVAVVKLASTTVWRPSSRSLVAGRRVCIPSSWRTRALSGTAVSPASSDRFDEGQIGTRSESAAGLPGPVCRFDRADAGARLGDVRRPESTWR